MEKRYKEALGEASKLIRPKYRDEFFRFTESGEASEDFLRYLDNDKQAQLAVEKGLTAVLIKIQKTIEKASLDEQIEVSKSLGKNR